MKQGSEPTDFGNLFEGQKQHICDKGLLLVDANEEPRGVFYIRSGYVKGYRISKEGEVQLVAILGSHEIFPLYWALDEDHDRHFYETMSETVVQLLPKSEFKSAVMHDKALLRITVTTLLLAFRWSHQRIENLQLRSSRERVAFRLLYLADHFGTKEEGDIINISVPIVDQDLADAVASTRVTVNRIMRDFISEKLLERSDHHINILDYEGLTDIAGEEV
jgi:CRP/FNR family cyclic AMP-dependent transcriptional regulator